MRLLLLIMLLHILNDNIWLPCSPTISEHNQSGLRRDSPGREPDSNEMSTKTSSFSGPRFVYNVFRHTDEAGKRLIARGWT